MSYYSILVKKNLHLFTSDLFSVARIGDFYELRIFVPFRRPDQEFISGYHLHGNLLSSYLLHGNLLSSYLLHGNLTSGYLLYGNRSNCTYNACIFFAHELFSTAASNEIETDCPIARLSNELTLI